MTSKKLTEDIKKLTEDISIIKTIAMDDAYVSYNNIKEMIIENRRAIYNIPVCDIPVCDIDRRMIIDIEEEIDTISKKFDQFSVEIEGKIDSLNDDTNEVYEAIDNAHEKLSQENEAILEKIDKIEDDIRDLREKLGEILTILYSR